MTHEQVTELSRVMFNIVSAFSETYGVKALMTIVVDVEIPGAPNVIKDSAGFSNMSAEELEIVEARIGQLYEIIKSRETNVITTSFSKN